jgi:DNA polymerase-3 subunit alpha
LSATFVHLHVHTEFSLAEGMLRMKPLLARAAALGMPALAVTERDNLFSLVKFYKAALDAGVKPIAGADLLLDATESGAGSGRMLLLCQNETGYRNLCRLVTRAYSRTRAGGQPVVQGVWLEQLGEGLIGVSAGREGVLGRMLLAGQGDALGHAVDWWRQCLPQRFYLELVRTGRDEEEAYIDAAVAAALTHDLPVVAGNDVCFLERGDFEAHEARVCIHEGRTLADPRRSRRHSDQQYLRSCEEMTALFEDFPEALENSVEIARRCNLELPLGKSFLPQFPVPDGSGVDEHFARESRAGLETRLVQRFGDDPKALAMRRPEYEARLERELEVIARMGFAGYFLIVADFIHWARENGVPVGPGRGSGAGSVAAWCLRITDLDPLQYDLLFERFLNPERVSLPDFDVDFCMDGRDRVIDYVARRYAGEDDGGLRVSQIITFGTMAAKAVVRDVGRVLGHPYGFVDQVAKLIPFELGMTLDKALEDEALRARYDAEEEVRAIVDLARKLEGLARNAGRHAGGVVIAPSALTDFTALYCEPGGGQVTQYDMKDVEAVGLVKFDFLGLRTLTIIARALGIINAAREGEGLPPVDVATLPTDDRATYELIKRGATTAVFQLESRGMKELIRRLQPDRFEDIIALVALFRPGPLQSGMVDDFIDRKHGRAETSYPHECLAPVLEPTYGVILYQEQVMQIAQVLAGYSLGGADLLRRAMGKKLPEEMAKQRRGFVDGAVARGVEPKLAEYIFDLIDKFAGYGFNKSHSAAYALIAYQTAWLKAHYPAAFMAAVLSSDMDNTDKVVTFIDECVNLGLAVEPPAVTSCARFFTAPDEATVRYGLGAIKGVGASAVEAIVEEREQDGSYRDLFDFCRRVDPKRINRRVVEALVRAGALDDLGPSRAVLMASIPTALQVAGQHARDTQAGQDDMFGGALDVAPEPQHFEEAREWTDDERLAGEKETLGLYFSGHPVVRYEAELAHLVTAPLGRLRPDPERTQRAAGLVTAMRTMNSRNGRMAVLTLDDRSGRLDVVVYSDLFQRCRSILVKDRLLVASGVVNEDEFSGGCSMIAASVEDLVNAREGAARHLLLEVQAAAARNGLVSRLKEAMEPFRQGRTPVCVEYRSEVARGRIRLGADWQVRPSDDLLLRLREVLGEDGAARFEYPGDAAEQAVVAQERREHA